MVLSGWIYFKLSVGVTATFSLFYSPQASVFDSTNSTIIFVSWWRMSRWWLKQLGVTYAFTTFSLWTWFTSLMPMSPHWFLFQWDTICWFWCWRFSMHSSEHRLHFYAFNRSIFKFSELRATTFWTKLIFGFIYYFSWHGHLVFYFLLLLLTKLPRSPWTTYGMFRRGFGLLM